jgi:hypothetical protein
MVQVGFVTVAEALATTKEHTHSADIFHPTLQKR